MKGGDERNRVGAAGWGGERSCFASEKKKKRVFWGGGGEGTIPAPVGHRAMDSQWFENFFSSFVFSFLFFVDVSFPRPSQV